MRILIALALATAAAGCGQTGSLYLPDDLVETPVEIRGPGQTPPPAPPADEEDKQEKPATPPGR